MYRPKNTQERILHRYQISLGHLKKVVQMLTDDVYCIDILHQSQALRKALKETENLIMENHLQTCAVDDIRTGKGEKAVKEIMSVISHRN